MDRTVRLLLSLALALVLLGLAEALCAADAGTGFTYQGLVKKDGAAYTGTCEVTFSLWDALGSGTPPTGGNQISTDRTVVNLPVTNGLFRSKVDFGAGAFDGGARFLQIALSCPPGGAKTTLAPRQEVTPAPYAMALPGLAIEQNATSPNVIGGYGSNSVTAGAVGATIGGGGTSGLTNEVTDSYGTVGGGADNRAGDGAGTANDANFATIAGGYRNVAAARFATIGGGWGNLVMRDFGTIAGGGLYDVNDATTGNRVTAEGGTVGGGADNQAGFDAGPSFTYYSTVAGGLSNTASGPYAVVSGGSNNVASGYQGTVPGGRFNTASGDHSFAAGYRAKANHMGAFVWADNRDFDFSSGSDNSFRVRATGGGVRFVLGIDAGTGAMTWSCVASDGTSWSCSSDRNQKENLEEVDGRDILARLRAMPLFRWNGKGRDPLVKHLGPTAQDFRAAFGLGDDELTIATIDLDGVALAAIQALYDEAAEKDARISGLEKRLAELERRLAAR